MNNATVRTIIMPVTDMDASCAFYERLLGRSPAFRDGDRWAQFDAGGVTVALAGPGGGFDGGHPALGIKAADAAAAQGLAEHAAGVVPAERRGAHEVSYLFTDPHGHAVLVYAPLD